MAVQQFCLRWNNHQPNFISVFTDLLNNETLVDVTLAAEGKQLQAHKVVLSACSTYFQSLFTSNPCQHPIVILKDIRYNDLKTMVDFMYYGEVNVSQDQLPAILKTAETLKVKGLAEMPEGVSFSKSESQGSESPWSPGALRRKRLRKSSTGSSEQTSTEDAAGSVGSGGTIAPSPSVVKTEPNEPARDPSTESDTARSQSFDTDDQTPNTPTRTLSEDLNDSNIRWSSTEEQAKSHIQMQPTSTGWADWNNTTNSDADGAYWESSAKRKRSANPQGEVNFIAALEAVRQGHLGFCKAAKMYGVNNRTLWLEYKRRGYPLLRPSTKAKSLILAGGGTVSPTNMSMSVPPSSQPSPMPMPNPPLPPPSTEPQTHTADHSSSHYWQYPQSNSHPDYLYSTML